MTQPLPTGDFCPPLKLPIKQCQGSGNLCVVTMNRRPTARPQGFFIVYKGNQIQINVA